MAVTALLAILLTANQSLAQTEVDKKPSKTSKKPLTNSEAGRKRITSNYQYTVSITRGVKRVLTM